MSKKILKRLKILLVAVLTIAVLIAVVGCNDNNSNNNQNNTVNNTENNTENNEETKEPWEISYWIPTGEDASYYDEYEQNPVAQYIRENYTFNGRPLHIDYYVPPAGSAADNYNTLIATGEYQDVLNIAMSSINPSEFYDEDMIYDLTDLVPEHMPNYMAFIEENPELEEEIYTIIDGEKKILTIVGFSDDITPNFQGFSYRRDWIAKYGENPETGEAFEYGFEDENDSESWYDNVIFPSGKDEPIYISDWEWMFEIFDEAFKEQEITDGYGYAPYFQGFMQTGDLACAFGGGASCYWYRNKEDKAVFGPATEDFRAYLECLNNWYEKGWIDQAFTEHNTDVFYAVDQQKVFSGKVGLWQGRQSTIGNQIDNGVSEHTKGAVVYGCRQPINDIYGNEESQNVEPYVFYQYSKTGTNVVLTKKMTEEEVIAFLEYADFLYSKEGSELKLGLNEEQVNELEPELYIENDIDTAYEIIDGKYVSTIPQGNPLKETLALEREGVGLSLVKDVDFQFGRYVEQATNAWDYYKTYPSIFGVQSAINAEDSQMVSNIRTNVDQFMIRSVSAIIMGNAYEDITDNGQWDQFLTDLNKYQPEIVTEVYQEALDLILGK